MNARRTRRGGVELTRRIVLTMEFRRSSLREQDEFGGVARGKSRVMKWRSDKREVAYVGREIVGKLMISGRGYGDGSGCGTGNSRKAGGREWGEAGKCGEIRRLRRENGRRSDWESWEGGKRICMELNQDGRGVVGEGREEDDRDDGNGGGEGGEVVRGGEGDGGAAIWRRRRPAPAGRLHAGNSRSRQGEAAVSTAAHGGAVAVVAAEAAVGLLP